MCHSYNCVIKCVSYVTNCAICMKYVSNSLDVSNCVVIYMVQCLYIEVIHIICVIYHMLSHISYFNAIFHVVGRLLYVVIRCHMSCVFIYVQIDQMRAKLRCQMRAKLCHMR